MRPRTVPRSDEATSEFPIIAVAFLRLYRYDMSRFYRECLPPLKDLPDPTCPRCSVGRHVLAYHAFHRDSFPANGSRSARSRTRRVALRNVECPCVASCPIDCRHTPSCCKSGMAHFDSFTESHVRTMVTHIFTSDTLRDARQALRFHLSARCAGEGPADWYLRERESSLGPQVYPSIHTLFRFPLDCPRHVQILLFSLQRSTFSDLRSNDVQERARIRRKVSIPDACMPLPSAPTRCGRDRRQAQCRLLNASRTPGSPAHSFHRPSP